MTGDTTSPPEPVIGVLGGTGPQGKGLALRLARSGLSVVIGSRDDQRAGDAARELGAGIVGHDNATCAQQADIVIVAVPYDGHHELLTSLADKLRGKIVIDCVNPLGFDSQGPFVLDIEAGSACEEAAEVLPDSTIVGAFHNVSAVVLLDEDRATVECDVLVLTEDRDAGERVIALADRIPGVRGVFAGRLRNARQVEALTANLIAINRRYKTHASLTITGI